MGPVTVDEGEYFIEISKNRMYKLGKCHVIMLPLFPVVAAAFVCYCCFRLLPLPLLLLLLPFVVVTVCFWMDSNRKMRGGRDRFAPVSLEYTKKKRTEKKKKNVVACSPATREEISENTTFYEMEKTDAIVRETTKELLEVKALIENVKNLYEPPVNLDVYVADDTLVLRGFLGCHRKFLGEILRTLKEGGHFTRKLVIKNTTIDADVMPSLCDYLVDIRAPSDLEFSQVNFCEDPSLTLVPALASRVSTRNPVKSLKFLSNYFKGDTFVRDIEKIRLTTLELELPIHSASSVASDIEYVVDQPDCKLRSLTISRVCFGLDEISRFRQMFSRNSSVKEFTFFVDESFVFFIDDVDWFNCRFQNWKTHVYHSYNHVLG